MKEKESNYDLNSLFHPQVEMGDTVKNTEEYQPTADRGQNGVYKSVVRFVPWWSNPNNSISDKWVCWLVDPISNRGRSVDCPSTVGKQSILQDMFFKLRKSESVQEKAKAQIFSRRRSFAALIQVIKDDQNKDLVGKILVWKFGIKVWEKINAEKKPVIGEPHEAFDLLDGKAFAVVVTKTVTTTPTGTMSYNNYDQSKFLDKKIPLYLKIGDKLQSINEKTPQTTVFNYLKENSPDLNKYAYKEWDQETKDYVNQVIVAVTGQTPSAAYADLRNPGSTPAAGSKKPDSGITSTDLTLDDLNSGLDNLSNMDLDIPELNLGSDNGIGGDLDEALNNI